MRLLFPLGAYIETVSGTILAGLKYGRVLRSMYTQAVIRQVRYPIGFLHTALLHIQAVSTEDCLDVGVGSETGLQTAGTLTFTIPALHSST